MRKKEERTPVMIPAQISTATAAACKRNPAVFTEGPRYSSFGKNAGDAHAQDTGET